MAAALVRPGQERELVHAFVHSTQLRRYLGVALLSRKRRYPGDRPDDIQAANPTTLTVLKIRKGAAGPCAARRALILLGLTRTHNHIRRAGAMGCIEMPVDRDGGFAGAYPTCARVLCLPCVRSVALRSA